MCKRCAKNPIQRFLYHYVPNLAGSPHLAISIAEASVGSYNDIQVDLIIQIQRYKFKYKFKVDTNANTNSK